MKRAAIAFAKLSMGMCIATLPVARAHAQTPQVAKTSYASASIQRSTTDFQGTGLRVRGTTLESINTSLDGLVEFAYETQRQQVRNLPSWGEDRYDLSIVFPGEVPPNDQQCKQMIRELLAQRFGLATHQEASQQESYGLFLAPGGAKLAATMSNANGLPALGLRAPGSMDVRNATASDLAQELQRDVAGRPIVDRTHLTGRYDFTLKWIATSTDAAGQGNLEKSSLNRALEDQLGLTLQKMTSPAPVLVVDSVTQPVLPE